MSGEYIAVEKVESVYKKNLLVEQVSRRGGEKPKGRTRKAEQQPVVIQAYFF